MAVLLLAVVLLLPRGLAGQAPARAGEPPSVPILLAGPRRAWPEPGPAPLSATDPGVAAGASLILPGAGQLLLGQRRWPIYAALEAVGWLVHLDRRRSGRRLRSEYRDVAWLAARSAAPEPRQDGDWEYYERLEHWETSGRWDADPIRVGLQPETDPTTFNGSVWALATDLFLSSGGGEGSPGYQRALDYYQERAYPPALLWDWTGEEASLARYRDLIDESDEQLRTATVVLGAVVANHLFSAADAFVSARLAARPPVGASAAVRPGRTGPRLEWRLEIRP